MKKKVCFNQKFFLSKRYYLRGSNNRFVSMIDKNPNFFNTYFFYETTPNY